MSAKVQSKSKTGVSVTSLALAAGDGWAAPVSGHLLFAWVAISANTPATLAISGWTALNGGKGHSTAAMAIKGFYKISDGSETTVTVTYGGSAVTIRMAVEEFSGNVASSPLDVTGAGQEASAATSLALSSITPASAELILVAAEVVDGANTTFANTWTNSFTQDLIEAQHLETAYRFVTGGAGSYTTTEGWTSNHNAVGMIAAFKAVSGAPVNTVLPAVTGGKFKGQLLTGTDGSWSNAPTSFARQWKRAGVAIGGATGSTYMQQAADVGNAITFEVVATNASGSSAPAVGTPSVTTGPAYAPNMNNAAIEVCSEPMVATYSFDPPASGSELVGAVPI